MQNKSNILQLSWIAKSKKYQINTVNSRYVTSCNKQELFLVGVISDFRESTILCASENLCLRRFQITTINLLIRTFLKWGQTNANSN